MTTTPTTLQPIGHAPRAHRPEPDSTGRADPSASVVVHGLTKTYGRRTVVDSLDFTVPAGRVTGLIGPNGAGKTTIMAMLLGLVRPTAGSGTVLGLPLDAPTAFLPRVGALIEGPAFHPALSGGANLAHLATLGHHDPRRISDLLDLVGLTGRDDDRVGSYSLGMKQRLGIAAALLCDPLLVVLDEPSNGVDPVGMRDLRAIIRTIAARGCTVLVSSHLLGELEQVCDHLIVIDRGRVVHQGPPADLPRSSGEALRVVPLNRTDRTRLVDLARDLGLSPSVDQAGVTVPTAGRPPRLTAVAVHRAATAAGIELVELTPRHTDLESRYLELVAPGTGTTAADAHPARTASPAQEPVR